MDSHDVWEWGIISYNLQKKMQKTRRGQLPTHSQTASGWLNPSRGLSAVFHLHKPPCILQKQGWRSSLMLKHLWRRGHLPLWELSTGEQFFFFLNVKNEKKRTDGAKKSE